MKKSIFFLFFSIVQFSMVAQKEDAFFQNIKDVCRNLESPIKNAEIKNLKNATPPKDTWTYSDLLEYKNYLSSNKENILYGFYIEPTQEEGIYGYNSFAYIRTDDDSFKYFYAIIISVNTNNNKFLIEGSYLFTASSSLESWWKHTLWYYENEKIKEVPEKFLYFTCPPPPFKS